jgi:hypothetical protein
VNDHTFASALRAFVRRTPFRPFQVELTSGDRFRIPHPEALSMRGDVAMYIGRDGTVKLFDCTSVCQLWDEPTTPPLNG